MHWMNSFKIPPYWKIVIQLLSFKMNRFDSVSGTLVVPGSFTISYIFKMDGPSSFGEFTRKEHHRKSGLNQCFCQGCSDCLGFSSAIPQCLCEPLGLWRWWVALLSQVADCSGTADLSWQPVMTPIVHRGHLSHSPQNLTGRKWASIWRFFSFVISWPTILCFLFCSLPFPAWKWVTSKMRLGKTYPASKSFSPSCWME